MFPVVLFLFTLSDEDTTDGCYKIFQRTQMQQSAHSHKNTDNYILKIHKNKHFRQTFN